MLKSPGQEIIENPPKVVTIRGASLTGRVVVGVTLKGPMGLGNPTTSWDEWVATYGGFIDTGWAAYAVYAIYRGNPGARVYTVRVAHYADVEDKSTLAAKASKIALKDTAAAPLDTATVAASSEGTWGDKLKVRITANGEDKFDLVVLEVVNGQEVVQDTFTGLNMDPASPDYAPTRITGKRKKMITFTDLFNGTPQGATKLPAAGTFALAAGNDGLAGLVDTDFIGDAKVRSGIYGMNTINEAVAFAVPGKTTTTVHQAAIAYSEARKNRYFVGDLPFGLDAQEAADYRTLTLETDTDYAEFNWPHLAVTDPATGQRKTVPNSGFILAAMGRTFDNPAKGPWKTASGVEDGQMTGAVGLENEDANDQDNRDIVYQAHINPIYFVPNFGICRMGSLTLTKDPNKNLHINQRWTFIYCEQSIKDGTAWENGENINGNLFKKAERTIKAFLLNVWKRGGLKGDKPTEAFFVQVDEGNNPLAEVQGGNLRHRIGLAIHTPADFQYFEFERDTRAELAQA